MERVKYSVAAILAAVLCIGILTACRKAPPRLDAPVVTLEGRFLYWDGIEGAVRYDVYVDGGYDGSVSDPSEDDPNTFSYEFKETLPGSYALKVKAIAGKGFSDGDFSGEDIRISIKGTLGKPVLAKDGATVTWNAVPNASGYIVTVNNASSPPQAEASYTVTGAPGNYVVTVRAAGGGDVWNNGANSDPETVTLANLAPPLGLNAAGGVLSWAAVANARSYTIAMYKNGANAAAYTFTAAGTQFDLNAQTIADGLYNVKVKAAGDGGLYFDSAESGSIEIAYGTRLDTPQGLGMSALELSWGAVVGSEGYVITVRGNGAPDIVKEVAENVVALRLTESDFAAAGVYTVYVSAKGGNAGYIDSEAAAYTVTRLAKPVPVVAGRRVSWGDVGAVSYEISVGGVSQGVAVSPWTNSGEPGDYTVVVKALGNNADLLGSASDPIGQTVSDRIDAPANVLYNGAAGILSWDDVPAAAGYKIYSGETLIRALAPADYIVSNGWVQFEFTAAPGVYENIGVAAAGGAGQRDSEVTPYAGGAVTVNKILRVWYYIDQPGLALNGLRVMIGTGGGMQDGAGNGGRLQDLLAGGGGEQANFPLQAGGSDSVFTRRVDIPLLGSASGTWKFAVELPGNSNDRDCPGGGNERNRTLDLSALNPLWGDGNVLDVYLVYWVNQTFTRRSDALAAAGFPAAPEVVGLTVPSAFVTGVPAGVTVTVNAAGALYYAVSSDAVAPRPEELVAAGIQRTVAAGANTFAYTPAAAGSYYFYAVLLAKGEVSAVASAQFGVGDPRLAVNAITFPSAISAGSSVGITVSAGAAGTLYYIVSSGAVAPSPEYIIAEGASVSAAIGQNGVSVAFGDAGNYYIHAVLADGDIVSDIYTSALITVKDGGALPDDGVPITNAAEFQAMLTSPAAGTKYYIVNDIDLTGVAVTAGVANFSGQLIGWNGGRIIGLTLTSRGMFHQIQDGAVFKDLIFISPRMNVSSGIREPKGLLGISVKSGTVTLDNVIIVDFIMTVTGGESNASGGLFGETNPGNSGATAVIITNSYIDIRMEGDGNFTRAGGIVGRTDSGGTVGIEITDSYVRFWRGEGGGRAGGIVGNGSDGTLNLALTRVAVEITANGNSENGGLIGRPDGLKGAVTLVGAVFFGAADLNRLTGPEGDAAQTYTYDGETAARNTALKTVADTAYIEAFADGNANIWRVDGGVLVFLSARDYLA
ncbi:MAG: hypothetical protein LBL66_07930 [Clostridiales bacterium]|jgi:hypothetical protein|nr:hypothetical protein [Clostridiales bacterium]